MYEIVITEKKGWLVDKKQFTEEALQEFQQYTVAAAAGVVKLPKKSKAIPLEVEMFRQTVDELDLSAVIRAVNGL